MTTKSFDRTQQIAVVSYSPLAEIEPPCVVETLVPKRAFRLRIAAAATVGVLLFGCAVTLCAWLWTGYHERVAMQEKLAALERLRESDAAVWRQSSALLARQLDAQNQQIESLHDERRQLEFELVRAATARPRVFVQPVAVAPASAARETGAESAAAGHQDDELGASAAATETDASSVNPQLRHAIESTRALQQTQIAEPPTLESIRSRIKSGDPSVVSNKLEAEADRSRMAKLFTHPIFIDSAVLAGSLLVPASLPLTLAQSRLGRNLTRRVLKETDSDKSVAGKVAQDVGNMPVTRRRSRR